MSILTMMSNRVQFLQPQQCVVFIKSQFLQNNLVSNILLFYFGFTIMGCGQSSESLQPRTLQAQRSPEMQEGNSPNHGNIEAVKPIDGVDQGHLKMLTQAQNLQKQGKNKDAISLYLQLKDIRPISMKALTGLSNCYRLLSKYDDSIKCGIQSCSVEDNQMACNSVAICYRVKKDYENAIKWIQKGISINDKYPNLYNSYGKINQQKGEKEKAKIYFMKAIEVDPTFDFAYVNLAKLSEDQKNYDQAIRWYQKQLQIAVKKQTVLFNIAVMYKNKIKDEDKALEYLAKCVDINPKDPLTFNTLGNIQLNRKNWAQAEIYFKKSIQFDPEYAYPYNGLGNAFYGMKKYNESIIFYQKSIELDSQYATPLCGLGDAYKQLGQLQKSIQAYQKSTKLDAKNSNTYNGLGNVYKAKGNLQQSIKWLKKAIEVDPKNEHPYNGLGNAYRDLKDFVNAEKAYLDSIKVNPKYAFPYNGIAIIYANQNNSTQAQKWYRKCMEVDPKYQRPYGNLGNLYCSLNRQTQGIELYQKALLINEKDSAVNNSLGIVYTKRGQDLKAVQYFKRSIKIDAKYALAMINLGICYIKMQNYSETFSIFKKAQNVIQTSDRDNYGGCKSFITSQLSKFKEEMSEWQFKSKLGYITEQDKLRIQNLRKQFQKRFSKMFDSSEDNNFKFNPSNLNQSFLHILKQIKQDQFILKRYLQIAKENYDLFKKNMDYINILAYIFCKYFWNLRKKSQTTITQIQNQLQAKIDKLCEVYPPSNSQTNEVFNLNLIKTVAEKRINLFQKIEYFNDYRYLVKQIDSIHQKCKLVLPKFKELIYQISASNQGFHTKSNLKMPERQMERFKVYIRIMQKMFSEVSKRKQAIINILDDKIKKDQKAGMHSVISILIEVWTDEINNILHKRIAQKLPTECFITDFVRGKSMFKNVKDIEGTANSLIVKCNELKYEVTQIDNRLNKPTKDLVFKILIDGIVCEFQIALQADTVQYNFSHCLYEIKRSPMGCIFGSFLILSKYEQLSFIKEARQIEKYYREQKLSQDDVWKRESPKFLIESFQKDT